VQFTNRIAKIEIWCARNIPPETPPTAADVVCQLREAFAYVQTRASMAMKWGTDEWLRCFDGAGYVAPRHPALPPVDGQLNDFGFLDLFRQWLAYRNSDDGDPPFGFPTREQWDTYADEVWQAWQAGTSPAAWKARQATTDWQAPVVAATNGQAEG
jgi:hypothetical protein